MAPQIKTYTELVSSMLTAIGQWTGLTNFNIGSVVRTLTEVVAEVVGELYAFGAEMLKQGFLDTATGIWLDRKAREYGLERKPAIIATINRNALRGVLIPFKIRYACGHA